MLSHEGLAIGWMPQSNWRQPLLLSIFLAHFPLGQRYWTEIPAVPAFDNGVS
jgi:hypothetical protein